MTEKGERVHISLVRGSSRHNKKGLKPTRAGEAGKKKRKRKRERKGEKEEDDDSRRTGGTHRRTGCTLQNVTLPGTSDH